MNTITTIINRDKKVTIIISVFNHPVIHSLCIYIYIGGVYTTTITTIMVL